MPQALSLKGRALRWLAQREHTRAELERKLRAHLAKLARQDAAAQTARAGAGRAADRGAAAALDSFELRELHGIWHDTAAFAHTAVSVGTAATIDVIADADAPVANIDTANTAAATEAVVPQPDIAALLDELAAKGLLSDTRAAESLLAGRGSRLGPLRLRQELQARGFDADLVQATLARSRADELARAGALWQRRFGAVAADPREAARQMRFLAARGFTAEVVARIVRGRD